jgi:hypothetical protein
VHKFWKQVGIIYWSEVTVHVSYVLLIRIKETNRLLVRFITGSKYGSKYKDNSHCGFVLEEMRVRLPSCKVGDLGEGC